MIRRDVALALVALAFVAGPLAVPHAAAAPGADCVANPTMPACIRIDAPVVEPNGWGLPGWLDTTPTVPATYPNGDAASDSMVDDVAPFYPRNCGINTVDAGGETVQTLECYPDEDAEPQAIIDWATAMASEYQRLTLTPSPIHYQPAGDWALVNMDFIVYTDSSDQILSTALFGVNIEVRSTPVHYNWDFGDGSALATSDAGAPYPNHTVSHVYSSASDGLAVSLTTSWQGEFRVEGTDAWIPIAGLANTSSSTGPIEIVAMDVNLVPNEGA